MQSLIKTIETGYERRGQLGTAGDEAELSDAVAQAIALLDSGEARVAEKENGAWRVNQWLKKAVLLSFRLADNVVMPGGHSNFYDKVPLKFADFGQEEFHAAGVRVVPDAIVRKGAYVAPGVVLMPSYRADDHRRSLFYRRPFGNRRGRRCRRRLGYFDGCFHRPEYQDL